MQRIEIPVLPEVFAEIRAGRQRFLFLRGQAADADWKPGMVVVCCELGDEAETEERTVDRVHRVNGADAANGDVVLGFREAMAPDRAARLQELGELGLEVFRTWGIVSEDSTSETVKAWHDASQAYREALEEFTAADAERPEEDGAADGEG